MGNKFQQQIKVVSREDIRPGVSIVEAAFFDADGEPFVFDVIADPYELPVADHVAAVATANGTDLATTQALANQLKTTVNAILVALEEAGHMAAS